MIVDMFMTIPIGRTIPGTLPESGRWSKKGRENLASRHFIFLESSGWSRKLRKFCSRRKRTEEKNNVNKPRFRFYLRSREITKLSFPSYTTRTRKKRGGEGGRGRRITKLKLYADTSWLPRDPRLINHRSRSTLRSRHNKEEHNIESRGRGRRNSHGVPRDSAGRKQAGIISSWSRDRIDFGIVFAWPAITAGSYEAAGGELAPVGSEREQETRRGEEGPRGDRWGGEGGGNSAGSVYLNLNIMQIDRDKMNNNCNSRGGGGGEERDEERIFVLDKRTKPARQPCNLPSVFRFSHRREFLYLSRQRFVTSRNDATLRFPFLPFPFPFPSPWRFNNESVGQRDSLFYLVFIDRPPRIYHSSCFHRSFTPWYTIIRRSWLSSHRVRATRTPLRRCNVTM